MTSPTLEHDATEDSGRADITRIVEEWGIRFWDAEQGKHREVTFSKDYACKYLGDAEVEVIRRLRTITPDRVTGWFSVTEDELVSRPGQTGG